MAQEEQNRRADDKQHNLGEVWEKVNFQGSEISSIKTEIGGIKEALVTLSGAVQRINDKINAPTNYIGLVAVGLSLLAMFGGFTYLITDPLADAIAKNYAAQQKNEHDHLHMIEKMSYQQAKIESLEARVAKHDEFMIEANFIHGQREELGKRVEAIDNKGSRAWNNSPPTR